MVVDIQRLLMLSSRYSHCLTKCRLGVWIVAAVLTSFVTAAPMKNPLRPTNKPRWKNPCGIPGHVFNAKEDLVGAPPATVQQLFDDILHAAKVARQNGMRTKDAFLNKVFNEPEFELSVEYQKEVWLPDIPKLTFEYLKQLKRDEAFRTSYQTLQYFAVGLEQAILDQLDQKMYLQLFRNAENELVQVLCELQRSMIILGIKPNADVERKIMKQTRRNITVETHRNLRDYLILRDYIKAVDFVVSVFDYLKSTHESN
ncbi:uncharacterized protein [Centruroides vittatus]|uniref:uncharacterized protein isoform X2 n=1 Tax=Centruroides vittatus TaxID=120091 RepID=UPI00350F0E0F